MADALDGKIYPVGVLGPVTGLGAIHGRVSMNSARQPPCEASSS